MTERGRRRTKLGEGGFTVMELLIYLFVAVIVVAGVYNLLIGQNRLYMKQRELQDVRGTLRAAANLLAFELRQVSAAGGDLYAISTYDVELRSIQGSGIVCGIHGSASRFGIFATGGEFGFEAGDSAMFFEAGGAGTDDDAWFLAAVNGYWGSPSAGGVPSCDWAAVSAVPELVLAVDTPLAALSGVQVGAPIREFRRVAYGLYLDPDGRWWLGRKVGSATDFEKLTGPLSAPPDSGLAFVYYDQSGSATADPTQVRMVDIVLRGESYGKVPSGNDLGPVVEEDTLRLRVSLRG